MSFTDLGLAAPLAGALSAAGYTAPTAVQSAAIPAALAGADLMVSSQTGSGKTAAFVLPSLQRVLDTPARPGKGPRVLVLAPTRELALQVNEAATGYARGLRGFSSVALVGGSPYAPQLRRLSRPVDLAVATPGRLLDHVRNGCVDFSRLEVLVLDEADRMLDMGFLDDIEQIVARTPASRQTLLFSATLDGVVGGLAQRLTRAAKRIDVSSTAAQKADIEQILLFADDLGHKNRLLDALLRGESVRQCVVFAATRQSAEDLRDMLAGDGFSVAALHGDMHQGQRNRTLQALRNGRTQVLVATDVAARGIDVAGISHVINFDVPRQAADYLHRIGRTGRAGRSGVAVTLLRHDERHRARAIERYTGQPIRVDVIPGLEPKARPQAAPKRPAGRPAGRRAGGFGDGRFGGPSAGAGNAGYGPRNAGFGSRNARFGSDAARSGSDNVRSGSDNARFGSKGARFGSDKTRFDSDARFGPKHARVEPNAASGSTGTRFEPHGRRGSDFAYGDGSFVSQPHPRTRRPAPADGVRQAPWRDGAARSARRSIDGRPEAASPTTGRGGSFTGNGRKGFSDRDRRS